MALLLKGMAFKAMKPTDMKTAALHFREVIRLSPYFFKAYEELVQCHLQQRRKREALAVADEALDKIGVHANTLTLCATVSAYSHSTKNKAKLLLDRALSRMPGYIPAIEAKTNLLFDSQKYIEALNFALENIEICVCSGMHVLVGNCYLEISNYTKAVEHFGIAFRLNENCKEAQIGLRKAELKHIDENEGGFEADSEEADGSLAHEIMFTDNL